MESERSHATIEKSDLEELYEGSVKRLEEYFFSDQGRKWLDLYEIRDPLAVALCQGAALHFYDKTNGIKDFDVWFFFPFNRKHLPYRTYWNWDYKNPKFGRHPQMSRYRGRKVDVLVRSIRNYTKNDPIKTIHQYLQFEDTGSSAELAKKAVVMLSPKSYLGEVIWYRHEI